MSKIISSRLKAIQDILTDFKHDRLNSLYARLYPSLLIFASRNLGVKYAFLAEDCVQNAVFSAWQHRDDFKTVNTLKSFLYVTIRNQSISILRKDGASNRYISALESDTGFENAVIEQETLTILYQTIQSLPEKYARVLQMSYFKGMKIAEIAEVLNVSESTVKKNKAVALDLLRERLAVAYGDRVALTLVLALLTILS